MWPMSDDKKWNIDVKNIDVESKASMFSMFPMLMSHH